MSVRRILFFGENVFNYKVDVQLKHLNLVYRNNSSNFLCPLKQYDLKISQGKLVNDNFQRKVVQKLQRVYDEIQIYQPQKRNFLSRLLPFKTKVNVPKGLYLYGAVGGGKTMLMDLFFNCCNVKYLHIIF